MKSPSDSPDNHSLSVKSKISDRIQAIPRSGIR